MNTARLNITLPEDVAHALAGVKNKSAFIAEAIREKHRVEEKKKARKTLEAAYKQAAKEDFATYKEWEATITDKLDDEAW